MAEMWIWNSIATRKRSPSDGFLENGLGLLKACLEERDHHIRVIDWQKSGFYDKLCFKWLLSLNRISTIFLFWLGKKRRIYTKLFYPFFNALQDVVTLIRKARMKRFLKKLARELIKSRIKVFGIKVWYGEAFIFANWLINYIKQKDPSILVVAGGFHVTLYEEDFLKNSVFDLGIIAEGEKPLEIILDIVDRNIDNWNKDRVLQQIKQKIEAGELKNTVYRDAGAVKVSERYTPRMEAKPFPKYEKENVEGKLKIHILLDSSGCPWGKCHFCVHHHFHPKFHPRPIENIVSEIEYMLQEGVGLFRFAGSETPPKFGMRIAQTILNKGLNIKYSIGCRAVSRITNSEETYLTVVENYEIMLKAGLRAIFMGGETGNDVINERVMNKGVTRRQIVKTAEAYREAQKRSGIKAYLSLALIYPTPLVEGVNLEEVFRDNLDLVEEILPDSVIISPGAPFKQTKWYQQAEKFGFEIPEDFIERMMKYEYVLYKLPSLWPPLEIKIGGIGFKQALAECERLRKAVEGKGIPSDLTDECFLMIEGAGYSGKRELERFKKETSIDLISSDYRNIERIAEQTNRFSQQLAEFNVGGK